eukprot:TRINITY_DN1153_c0_g1_i1.p1 TRINITY_DN1153_c0_g1~~TRINITY_DN1153_c0_g1_i1.p1  ORF type:complete len:429 (-),score=66.52 TRINITY_DN1153_c0_g1_i1:120-1406(-)
MLQRVVMRRGLLINAHSLCLVTNIQTFKRAYPLPTQIHSKHLLGAGLYCNNTPITKRVFCTASNKNTAIPSIENITSTTKPETPIVNTKTENINVNEQPPPTCVLPNEPEKEKKVDVVPQSLPRRIIALIEMYGSLSKFRLSTFIVITSMVGYLLAPYALPFDYARFIYSTVGTSLACASANTLNQIIEVSYDAQMARTAKRTLPTGKLTITHATAFGVVTGLTGCALLATQVNLLSAALALANIIIYAFIYTPMKRITPLNTWVGAVVGAIPPMIGWTSVTNDIGVGAYALATLLFVWQIPHFLSLSWNLRGDYAKAGYKMLSNVSPTSVGPVALLWSIGLAPVPAIFSFTEITTWMFALDSLPLSLYLIYASYNFYKDNSSKNSRKFFFTTLWYLPVVMVLMIIHKIHKPKKEEKKEDVVMIQNAA